MCSRTILIVIRTPLPIRARATNLLIFPPGLIVLGSSNVGKNRVLLDHVVGIAVGLGIGTRHHPKITRFGIDRPHLTFVIHMQPGNVIAECPDFPVSIFLRRYQHRQICFAAGRWEGCSNVMRFALWTFQTKNQHVLSQPAFLPRLPTGNTEGVTLLTQQSITTVT